MPLLCLAHIQTGFFLPARVLSRLFRRLFLEKLLAAHAAGQLRFFGDHAPLTGGKAFAAWLAPLRKIEWVVYAKPPFAGPKSVLAYLSRYTHRVAISNHRLIEVNENGITFHYKDYRDASKKKHVTLAGVEFLRRFSSHILPHGFVRIRHYGFLASRNKKTELNLAKKDLKQPEWSRIKYSWMQIAKEKLNYNPDQCPHCHSVSLVIIKIIDPQRGPPTFYNNG